MKYRLLASACGMAALISCGGGVSVGQTVRGSARDDMADANVDVDSRVSDASEAAVGPCSIDALPGVHICCGRPGEIQGTNCVSLSTVEFNRLHCVNEGGGFDLKDRSLGLECCDGLVAVHSSAQQIPVGPVQPDASVVCLDGPVGSAVCLKCGNGVCDPGENSCNCQSDCM